MIQAAKKRSDAFAKLAEHQIFQLANPPILRQHHVDGSDEACPNAKHKMKQEISLASRSSIKWGTRMRFLSIVMSNDQVRYRTASIDRRQAFLSRKCISVCGWCTGRITTRCSKISVLGVRIVMHGTEN
jgi:hypothetical protein